MRSLVPIFFVALCLSSSYADNVNITDYMFWKRADIEAWNEFFPSRILEEERLVIAKAIEAVNSLASNMATSLSRIVTFQAQELQTAEQLMNGTAAEGCINGIADYMSNAIKDAVTGYNDCTADALSNVFRLNITWTTVRSKYFSDYQKALTGIDVCGRTYPNKDSYERLKSCVESMNKNYFSAATALQSSLSPSPTMRYFEGTVVKCASEAARAVTSKGYQFIKMLIQCAILSGNIDPAVYGDQLSKWIGYNDTLAIQIVDAQTKNYYQISQVVGDMLSYYQMQKDALEQYIIQSRGSLFYLQKIYSYLSEYYNAVTMASLDNPGDMNCGNSAKATLDQTAYSSASKALTCDVDIVNNTRKLIADVKDKFAYLNRKMPSTGNVAILNCTIQGYIFAPNTIYDCYNLAYIQFENEKETSKTTTSKDVDTLREYEASFFNSSNLPCGDSILKILYLDGEIALYNMQRCLYISSGSTYSVTTPLPYTTSQYFE